MSDRSVEAELDHARVRGPVRDIVIPPCPELLRQLQEATAHGEPNPAELDRIASSDVAMAAALIRQANSPLYGLSQLARKDRTFTQTENANHRTDHAVVGAIVARTWRMPAAVAVAIRLHHDFTCLADARYSDPVRHLVAMGLIADHLVQQHEGVPPSADWTAHGQACLVHLQIGAAEVEHWVDELHPAFEAVQAP
ncbi:MAG: HDOD domain-containing protein [Tepidimonas sp.]|uniref:HDOD domain-containing protein n=1 Tax=Tepidimonas sp. TaxID=2002775 RepID=UPI004054D056